MAIFNYYKALNQSLYVNKSNKGVKPSVSNYLVVFLHKFVSCNKSKIQFVPSHCFSSTSCVSLIGCTNYSSPSIWALL